MKGHAHEGWVEGVKYLLTEGAGFPFAGVHVGVRGGVDRAFLEAPPTLHADL